MFDWVLGDNLSSKAVRFLHNLAPQSILSQTIPCCKITRNLIKFWNAASRRSEQRDGFVDNGPGVCESLPHQKCDSSSAFASRRASCRCWLLWRFSGCVFSDIHMLFQNLVLLNRWIRFQTLHLHRYRSQIRQSKWSCVQKYNWDLLALCNPELLNQLLDLIEAEGLCQQCSQDLSEIQRCEALLFWQHLCLCSGSRYQWYRRLFVCDEDPCTYWAPRSFDLGAVLLLTAEENLTSSCSKYLTSIYRCAERADQCVCGRRDKGDFGRCVHGQHRPHPQACQWLAGISVQEYWWPRWSNQGLWWGSDQGT